MRIERRGMWNSWGTRGDNWEVSEACLDGRGGPPLREWEVHCAECMYVCVCVFACEYTCTLVVVHVCKYVFYLECGGQDPGLGSQIFWVLILAPPLQAVQHLGKSLDLSGPLVFVSVRWVQFQNTVCGVATRVCFIYIRTEFRAGPGPS